MPRQSTDNGAVVYFKSLHSCSAEHNSVIPENRSFCQTHDGCLLDRFPGTVLHGLDALAELNLDSDGLIKLSPELRYLKNLISEQGA